MRIDGDLSTMQGVERVTEIVSRIRQEVFEACALTVSRIYPS